MEIVEDRHGKKSIFISAQLPVSKWHEVIEKSTLFNAILDRMVHTARRNEVKGDSFVRSENYTYFVIPSLKYHCKLPYRLRLKHGVVNITGLVVRIIRFYSKHNIPNCDN